MFLSSRNSLSSQILKRIEDIYIVCTLVSGVLSKMCVVIYVSSITLLYFTGHIAHVFATVGHHCRKMAVGLWLGRCNAIALIRGIKYCSMKCLCNRTRNQLQLSLPGKNLTSCILTYCAVDLAFKHSTEWSVMYMV
jgi:hypothetical protein